MDSASVLRSAARSWAGVVEAKSKFGGRGLAFHVDGREFLHFHSPTRIDVRLTRAGVRGLPTIARAIRRPTPSDWVELVLSDARDLGVALAAARAAWQAARSPRPRGIRQK